MDQTTYRCQLQVKEAVEAIELEEAGSWRWLGRPMAGVTPSVRERLNAEELRGFLRDQITNCLYGLFYTRGRAIPPPGPSAPTPRQSPAVVAIAEQARGRVSWSQGWEVVAQNDKNVELRRYGILINASAGNVIYDSDDPGRARVLIPGLAQRISPGFLMLRGSRDLVARPEEGRLRLYWSVHEGGVMDLFLQLTNALDEAEIPYRFKVARFLEEDPRCDTAVLYFRTADWTVVNRRAAVIRTRIASWLSPGTPAFALALAPGLALAEDPVDGGSFGRSRSALLAECLLDAYEQGIIEKAARLDFVFAAIRRRGFDPAALHLGPHSTKVYAFPQAPESPASVSHPALAVTSSTQRDVHGLVGGRPGASPLQPDEALAVACAIGEDLVSRAWWHRDMCTWVGATPVAAENRRGRGPETWVSVGPEVYGGLAGIAFFLSELNAAASHPGTARAARGALASSLERDETNPNKGGGLYTGQMGIALVQARFARLNDDPKGMSQALDRARRAAVALHADPNPDLLYGKAGGIIGLLALAALSEDTTFVDVAQELGDQLVEAAVPRGTGRAWGLRHGAWPLTGYSHGVAGIVHALAELYTCTGQSRFRRLAFDALRYEDEMYDLRAGNWPDFRLERDAPVLPRGDYPTVSLWCHGAPGILAARRRVKLLLDGEDAQVELTRARKATLENVERQATDSIGTWCLCHGVAGNAWTLVHGGPVAPCTPEEQRVAESLAGAGAARHRNAGTWPCGVGGGWSPAYMAGVAGTGAFFLGLARRDTPSFLIPIPEMFA